MKRVLVEGYAKNNLGDDLFFYILLKRYVKTEFTFNFSNSSKMLKKIKNAVLIQHHFRTLAKEIQFYDVFVVIGGSMFQQPKNKLGFKKWLSLFLKVLLFRMHGKKVVFIGFNFGPYHSNLFYCLYKILFRFVNFLSVRDKRTFELFKKNKRLYMFPDIVFGLHDKILKTRKSRSVAISVMDFGPNNDFQEIYENFLKNTINTINSNIKVVLYGFQVSDEINDLKVINRLEGEIDRKVDRFYYDGQNMKKLIQNYCSNYFAITTRFHSLVLSLKAHQQIISVDYNIKVGALLDTLQLNNLNITMSELQTSKSYKKVANAINNSKFDKEFSDNYISLEKMTEVESLAENHFNYLDRILGVSQ